MQVSDALLDHYARLESRWTVADRASDYGRLVVPLGNSDVACHRWFHFKEAFSSDLLLRVLKDEGLDSRSRLRVLDPFSGVGTTVVSAAALSGQFADGVLATGVERNPFLHLAASSKFRATIAPRGLRARLFAKFNQILPTIESISAPAPPALSTFSKEGHFPPGHLDELLRIRTAIEARTRPGLVQDLLLLCAAASVEASSRLRRDGRALRYESWREPPRPINIFRSRVAEVLEDIDVHRTSGVTGRVHLGDARTIQNVDLPEESDLILFSPPYPNNIDYTEVYKLEAWYLGYFRSAQAFTQQRRVTLRSHPSVKFEDSYTYKSSSVKSEFEHLVNPLLDAIPAKDRYTVGRQQVVRGWSDDMLAVLSGLRKKVSREGVLVAVVGNSSHGEDDTTLVIAADVLLARLGEMTGWKVEEIRMARRPTRRSSSPYLRESLVVLRPDDAWRT